MERKKHWKNDSQWQQVMLHVALQNPGILWRPTFISRQSSYLQCNNNQRELPPSISSYWLRWLKQGMKYDYIDGDFHQMILSYALLIIILLFHTIIKNHVCCTWISVYESWYIFNRKLKSKTSRTPTPSTVVSMTCWHFYARL